MDEDFIPRKDVDFIRFARNISNQLLNNPASAGFTPDEANEFDNLVAAFIQEDQTLKQKTIEKRTAATAKRTARKVLERRIRETARTIRSRSETTDELREAYGLPIPDRIRTRRDAPESFPRVVRIDNQNYIHLIHFRDSESGARRPLGAIGCEIWMAIGEVNVTPEDEDFRFVKLGTRSPTKIEFEINQVGKQAYYRLRWLARRGQSGGWGDTAQATITN